MNTNASKTPWRLFGMCALIPPAVTLILLVVVPVIRLLGLTSGLAPPDAAESDAPAEDRIMRLENVRRLETDRSFWQTRLALAKTDSLYLVIDLVDSVMLLEIKGVPVRRSPIRRFEMSAALRRGRHDREHAVRADTALTLHRAWATIPKAPIRMQYAPADTGGSTPPPMFETDTTSAPEDVALVLDFSPDLTVTVLPDQPLSAAGWGRLAWFRIRRRLEDVGREARMLARWTLPQPERWIELQMQAVDAKAVYRALPSAARMIVRL